MIRFLWIGVALVAFLMTHESTYAQTHCCLNASSAASAYLNPPVGEDNRFFTSGGGSRPNLAMVFMRHERMLELPISPYELRTPGLIPGNNALPEYVPAASLTSTIADTGCENSYLNSLNYFHPEPRNLAGVRDDTLLGTYSASKVYGSPEDIYQSVLAQGPPGTVSTMFKPGGFYTYRDWTSRCDDPGCIDHGSAGAACAAAGAGLAGSAINGACVSCLNTRGYWLNPSVTPVSNARTTSAAFTGNWLNFFPPKHVIMRVALKTVLQEGAGDGMRMSVFVSENSDTAGGGEVAQSNDTGGTRMTLHPNCTSGTPDKKGVGNGITRIGFRGGNRNPIAETLTNVGQHLTQTYRWKNIFGNGSSLAEKTTGAIHNDSDGTASRPHCTACTRHFILLFSDGRSDEGNPACVPDANGNPTPPCRRLNQCNSEGLGIELDGGKWIADVPELGQLLVTGAGVRNTPNGTCDRDYADDIARFLHTTDMYGNGALIDGLPDDARQFAYTYTVGVGSNVGGRQQILREMARAGGGRYINGSNYRSMVEALRSIFEDVNNRATAFSTTSVTQLQSTSSTSAFVPRFRPARDRIWNGYLFRWGVFNEFVENRDLNGDGDKEDVFLTQAVPPANATAADIVSEDENGNFVRPFAGNARGTPYWEAGDKLNDLGPVGRRIYTTIDRDASGYSDGRLDNRDQVVEFTDTNASLLAPYLGLEGTNTCSHLATELGDSTLSTDLVACARLVIRFTRGHDVLDDDGDLNRDEARDWLLGDIYHSAPILLDVPADEFLCDLGLNRQCARTLYGGNPATQLANYTEDGQTLNAYQRYKHERRTRDRLVLVGANDGMLHAFHAGAAIIPAPVPTADNLLPDSHDPGTGDEVWAFVPPDLLPKLKLRLQDNRHHIFVDGDVMIRDVWADSRNSGTPGVKEWEEFRTMVVVSLRRGGNHYMALDVTDPPGTGTWYPNAPQPRFKWMFPQPCSDESFEVGETWMTLNPKPPPIGPILIQSANTDATRYPIRHGVNTEERWAVFLQGGYDPNFDKGQALYALDVATGHMLWKASFDAAHTRHQHMRYSFAAPMGLVDFGAGTGTGLTQDGFFDTAVVGDVGGQVWVLRMFQPAQLNLPPLPTSSNPISALMASNWHVARTFQPDGLAESVTTLNPFFQVAANTFQAETGALRTFIGTGDRYNIRDPRAGTCRLDNPQACGKYGCEWRSNLTLDYSGRRFENHMHYKDKAVVHYRRTAQSPTSANACASFSARQTVELTSCPGSLSPGMIKDREVSCSGSPLTCSNPTILFNYQDWTNSQFSDLGLAPNRFYGLWSYGGRSDRQFNDLLTANTYDAMRFRESDPMRGLVDVTAATSTTGGASLVGNGWYLNYSTLPERTASGSALVSSCVLWNSMEAATGVSACSSGITYTSRLYQANYITGKPDCAASFNGQRSIVRQVISPPPEPAVVLSMSKTGEIKYQIQSFEPGGDQAVAQDVTAGQDSLQLVYSLEVPQSLHKCRHAATPADAAQACP